MDEGTGRVRGSRETKADDEGHVAAVGWASAWMRSGVGDRGLPACLTSAGAGAASRGRAGREGAAAPNGSIRKAEREPGKSDEIDALAVARAVVKDGVEQFPVAYLDEQAMEIRLLCDHRNDLIAERTRTVNRLRWHVTLARA